jgi:hypothetical protein
MPGLRGIDIAKAGFDIGFVKSMDTGMPECRSDVGFPAKGGPIPGVSRPILGKQLQCVAARQPRVLRKVHLAPSDRSSPFAARSAERRGQREDGATVAGARQRLR